MQTTDLSYQKAVRFTNTKRLSGRSGIPLTGRLMDSTVAQLKICIIGAGIGGLTCAMALATAGFRDIEVFEFASDLGFVVSQLY